MVESIVLTMKGTEEDATYGTAPTTETPDNTTNQTPDATGEEDKRFTYKTGELTYNYGSDGTTYTAQEGDKVELTFPGAWKEVQFSLPEAIDLSQCNSVTFAVSDQSVPMCFKLYTAEGEISDITAYSKTGTTVIATTGRTEVVTMVAVMLHSDDASETNTCVFDGVLFDMKEATESTETYTITMYASSLTKGWGSNATYELNDTNRLEVGFTASGGQQRVMLPASFDIDDCESMVVNIESQTAPFNLQTYNASTQLGVYYYNTGKTSYSYTKDGSNGGASDYTLTTVDSINFQQGGDYIEGHGVVVESIVLTMKGTEEDATYGTAPTTETPDNTTNQTPDATGEEDKRFTYKTGELTYNYGSDGTTYTAQEGDKVELTFPGAWKEVQFSLPEAIDLSQCNSVTFAVSDQSVPMCFKLYTAEGEISDITAYSKTGKTVIATTGRTEVVTMVAVMLHSDDVAETNTCVFDGVLFDMKEATTGEEEETYTITVYPSALTHDWSKDGITYELGSDNRLKFTFGINNQDSRWDMPVTLDWSKVTNITMQVCDYVGARPNVFFSTGNGTKVETFGNAPVSSNKVTMVPTVTSGTVDEFGLQASGWSWVGDGTDSITVESIVFTVKGTEEDATYGNAPTEKEPVDTSQNMTPEAESDEDFSWNGSDLTKGYDTTTSELDSTTSRWNVTFDSAWQEVRFELPEEVDLTMCNSVTFAVANQSAKMTLKMYTSDETEVFHEYHQADKNLYTYSTTTLTDKIKYVAIMLHSDDKVNASETCAFDGIYFDMIAEDEVEETYEKTFAASELTKDWANSTTCELTDAGWTGTFSELQQEMRFDLPESINLENCKTIIFTVSSQTGPVNLYVATDGTKINNYWYKVDATSYTVEPGSTSKINQIGIQCGGEEFTEGATITLESVTFVMKGSEPLPTPTDGVYSAEFFEVVEETNAADTEVIIQEATASQEAAVIVEFYRENASVIFEIPDTVDLNHLVSIDFGISKEEVSLVSTALPDVKVDLLDEDKNVIITSTESNVETKCNPEIKYFKLTATKADVAIKLTNVTFNIDENAFEAIVLNGNFAREDVSMWGSAVYGTVDGTDDGEKTAITVKTSATPIFDDVYTYGEISRRSSPYVGFAQNVSDRVTPGKTYNFSFWAKLSDDYADAPANQREVAFSPYSINPDGSENYGLVPTGGYKFSLTPGVWSKFSGTIKVPEDATGFYIRIIEQGTDYGKGECVLGSYAVTGVHMEETEPVKWENNPAAQIPNYTVTYTMEDLIVDWASATTENVNGDLKIGYEQNYSEARFKLPRALDMSKVLSVVVKIDGQNVPIAIKLYNKGKEEWVKYGSLYYNEYVLYPCMTGNVNGFGIMSLAIPNPEGSYANFESITFNMTEEPAPIPVSNDIVSNGYFTTEESLDDWKAAFWGEGVTMTQVVSDTPVVDGIYTYASYSKRTSPYQCFAQDITDKVEQNETYTFSFWARLSDDYKGAPAEMRTVQFGPYTVDKDGNPDYNPKLDGTYSQVLEPGVWTKFEGKYKVTNANEIGQVIIRILEQGTNYGQGECVLGGYDITGVVIEKYIPDPPSIDEDVPDLKDAITEVFGEDFIVGSAISGDEGDDIGVEMLVNKHFNALTLGNELKPDALFGYSNNQHTKLQTITFNGQELVVPTLNFSRAEMILDQIKKWNETHPEEPIKVRGHVLVWHSQTPEWFFRENYVVGQNADGSENYVSPEEMNLRMEWFIKTVLEHFTGEDSEYKDMFYGWDVVNEAVSDGGSGYRTDKVSTSELPSADTHSKNSSWWAVYQSNEYIIKAFQYANKYAPADVELYYNDYNDADSKKVTGIVALLKDVKAAEGTRIDAMGMQGHYNLFNPSNKSIEKAIRAYAEVVGNVQYTELDFKASGNISTEDGKQAEYLAQAERYHELYLLLQELDAEDGIEITGLTIWGTVDHYSWLQSASDVGGGGDGTMDQCPLLFDTNYKVKPSYWAFVDYTKVDPDWVPEVKEDKKDDKTEEKTDDSKEDVKTDEKADDTETKTEESATTEATESTEESKADKDAASEQPAVKKSNTTTMIIVVAIVVAVAAAAAVGTVLLKRKKK